MFRFVFLLIILGACSPYQKTIKSTDSGLKNKIATNYYKEGDYKRASVLFEQILPVYAGKPQGERIVFMYATAMYKLKYYYIAAYQFERFSEIYTKSDKLAEAMFLDGKCRYYLSPKYSLDQVDTKECIDKLQKFINTFPDDKNITEANKMVRAMNDKLAKKAFLISNQYYQIEDYKASVKSFENFLLDYPGNKFKQESLYLRIMSYYKLAINSFKNKEKERLELTLGYANSYLKYFPKSPFIEEVKEIKKEVEKRLIS